MTKRFSNFLKGLLTAALIANILFGSLDLYFDNFADWLSPHALVELGTIFSAFVLVSALWFGWWRSARTAVGLRKSLEAQREERDAWKASAQSALDGLGKAISAQFQLWQLTPSEREVALLLLKGHSHKEIATMTGRRERTVRQHSGVVYEKAGLAGRAELAAFFLQDVTIS
ncbi:MAG: LuxR C-terminal-related transcriptional regulator [Gemmatimonadota bacterium]|jgi:DNA-binding CsgD family transcriptional regulator|nr:LuxR C-terminal-related transcriptional regulator [Gemmatimonadota bacterium]